MLGDSLERTLSSAFVGRPSQRDKVNLSKNSGRHDNVDIGLDRFYHPIPLSQLADKEPGIQISDDDSDSEYKHKVKIDERIEKLRKRKITEDKINQDKLKILQLRKKEKNKEGSTTIHGQFDVLGRPLAIDVNFVDNTSLLKKKKDLPNMYPKTTETTVNAECQITKE